MSSFWQQGTLAQQAFGTWQQTSMECATSVNVSCDAHELAKVPLKPLQHTPGAANATQAVASASTSRKWVWQHIPAPLPLQRSPALLPDSDLDALLLLLRTSPVRNLLHIHPCDANYLCISS